MARTSTARERLEARVTPAQKAVLRRAASLRGQSLTDFIVSAAREAAERTIQTANVIELSMRDQRRLIEALDNSAEPNAALRAAARLYQQSSLSREREPER